MKDPQSSDSAEGATGRPGWLLADMTDKFRLLSSGPELAYLDPAPLLLTMTATAAEKRRTVLTSTAMHH